MWTNLLPCRKVHNKIEIIICRTKIFNYTVSACLQIFSGFFDPCPFHFIIGSRNFVTKDYIHNCKYILGFKLFRLFSLFIVSIPGLLSLFSNFFIPCLQRWHIWTLEWVKSALACLKKNGQKPPPYLINEYLLKPNYCKKQCSSSSFLLT